MKPLPKAMEETGFSAGRGMVPVWLIGLFAALFYWDCLQLDGHSGGFNALVYKPYATIEEVETNQPGVRIDPLKTGRKIYETTCVVCHQANGLGTPGQFPPLAGSEWVAAQSPARIIRIVLNGLQGPITVHGESFNNVMVPWRDVLSDTDIASVLTYVRQNQGWGNHASAVTADEVNAIREKTKSRDRAYTPAELLDFPKNE